MQELKSISQLPRKRRRSMIKQSCQEKLNTAEVLISKALIDSYISHDRFVSVNNTLRETNKVKEEIKNPETSVKYLI